MSSLFPDFIRTLRTQQNLVEPCRTPPNLVEPPELASSRREPDRLNERTVAGRIPHGEPHPGLSLRVEWDGKLLRAKRSEIRRRDDLPIDLRAVTPHDLYER